MFAQNDIFIDYRVVFLESAHCQLTCMARETGEIFESLENVVDGTACSYEKSNGICIQVWPKLLIYAKFKLSVFICIILCHRANVRLWAAIED